MATSFVSLGSFRPRRDAHPGDVVEPDLLANVVGDELIALVEPFSSADRDEWPRRLSELVEARVEDHDAVTEVGMWLSDVAEDVSDDVHAVSRLAAAVRGEIEVDGTGWEPDRDRAHELEMLSALLRADPRCECWVCAWLRPSDATVSTLRETLATGEASRAMIERVSWAAEPQPEIASMILDHGGDVGGAVRRIGRRCAGLSMDAVRARLTSPRAQTRALALEACRGMVAAGRVRPDEALDAFRAALSDESELVRVTAALGAGVLGERTDAIALVLASAGCRRSLDSALREEAMCALLDALPVHPSSELLALLRAGRRDADPELAWRYEDALYAALPEAEVDEIARSEARSPRVAVPARAPARAPAEASRMCPVCFRYVPDDECDRCGGASIDPDSADGAEVMAFAAAALERKRKTLAAVAGGIVGASASIIVVWVWDLGPRAALGLFLLVFLPGYFIARATFDSLASEAERAARKLLEDRARAELDP